MFAFVSRVSLQVQRSLTKAENALQVQSAEHPHGWGVAWYLTGDPTPQVRRSLQSAHDDEQFERLSRFLTSHTVLAHVRKATVGRVAAENTHPFVWGRWTFCHNGTVFGWDRLRAEVRAQTPPWLRGELRGDTDSEGLFYLTLGVLADLGHDVELGESALSDDLEAALGERLAWLRDRSMATGADPREPMMNLLLTDGRRLMATRVHGGLSFSTQKNRCADRDLCPIADKVCFGPRREGVAPTHLLVASDPTSDDDQWEPLPHGSMLRLTPDFRLTVRPLGGFSGEPWYP